MRIAIDAGVLGIMCHGRHPEHAALMRWLGAIVSAASNEIYIAAISDYELRRKLVHLAMRDGVATTDSLRRLDSLQGPCTFLPLTDATLRHAADLWATARHTGQPTAAPDRLDADVILAAQALNVGASVVTDNARHLSRYCTVIDWRSP